MNATQTDFDQFVDMLLAEKDLPELTDEVKAQLHADVLGKLQEFLDAKVIASLADDELTAFNDLLDKNASDEELQQFVAAKIPDHDRFLTQSLLEFRSRYLGQS